MSKVQSVLVDVAPLEDLEEMPIDKAVEALVEQAIQMNASDLFFIREENNLTLAVRHLGILRNLTSVNPMLGQRFIAHVKAVAAMDVAEKRRPLDGRWIYETTDGRRVDIRINTIPTLYGEDMAMRMLERDTQLRSLDELGLVNHQLNELNLMLNSPGGLILVTGPTGSGKTTTLYACLQQLHNGRRKIHTIEDPIEYALEGVRQSQINERIGLDFPDLLRGVLRQAPDIIMVGEIRDVTTAATAVRAAHSGHLVFATLHSPNATSAVQSMLSLGVSSHFLATCMRGVVAQRLVRTLCPKCKVAIDISESPYSFDEVKRWLEPDQSQMIYGPKGCESCFQDQYTDREGVFEILNISPAIRQMIADSRAGPEMARQARQEVQIQMGQMALLKVAKGITSIEEILRAIPSDILGLDNDTD